MDQQASSDEQEQIKIPEEITYELSSALKFSVAGDFDESFMIVMKAPTYKEKEFATKLKQLIYRAFAEAQRGATSEDDDKKGAAEDEEINASRVMVLMGMFGDWLSMQTVFEKMVTKVATVEGVELLPKHWREISIRDQERMCAEYVANFIMPLIMSEMKTAT